VPEELKKKTNNHGSFWICVRKKTWAGKLHDCRMIVVKLHFQNVFHPHENKKPAFSNFSGLRSVFEKLCFRDGLVQMVGLTVEIKL